MTVCCGNVEKHVKEAVNEKLQSLWILNLVVHVITTELWKVLM